MFVNWASFLKKHFLGGGEGRQERDALKYTQKLTEENKVLPSAHQAKLQQLTNIPCVVSLSTHRVHCGGGLQCKGIKHVSIMNISNIPTDTELNKIQDFLSNEKF